MFDQARKVPTKLTFCAGCPVFLKILLIILAGTISGFVSVIFLIYFFLPEAQGLLSPVFILFEKLLPLRFIKLSFLYLSRTLMAFYPFLIYRARFSGSERAMAFIRDSGLLAGTCTMMIAMLEMIADEIFSSDYEVPHFEPGGFLEGVIFTVMSVSLWAVFRKTLSVSEKIQQLKKPGFAMNILVLSVISILAAFHTDYKLPVRGIVEPGALLRIHEIDMENALMRFRSFTGRRPSSLDEFVYKNSPYLETLPVNPYTGKEDWKINRSISVDSSSGRMTDGTGEILSITADWSKITPELIERARLRHSFLLLISGLADIYHFILISVLLLLLLLAALIYLLEKNREKIFPLSPLISLGRFMYLSCSCLWVILIPVSTFLRVTCSG